MDTRTKSTRRNRLRLIVASVALSAGMIGATAGVADAFNPQPEPPANNAGDQPSMPGGSAANRGAPRVHFGAMHRVGR